jgi:hypothetical protein
LANFQLCIIKIGDVALKTNKKSPQTPNKKSPNSNYGPQTPKFPQSRNQMIEHCNLHHPERKLGGTYADNLKAGSCF